MIFDWKKHSEYILRNKTYQYEGLSSDNFEQINLLTYLIVDKSFDKNRAMKIWLNIANKRTEFYTATTEYFDFLWEQAINNVELYTYSQAVLKNIYIYKEEIDFLNNMRCSVLFKRYLLLLIIQLKLTKALSFNCEICNSEKNKIFALVSKKPRHWYHTLNTYEKKIRNIEFNKGQKIMNVTQVEDGLLLMDRITQREICCVECGKIFYAGSHCQTNYCPDCYRKHLNEKERIRKYRKRHHE